MLGQALNLAAINRVVRWRLPAGFADKKEVFKLGGIFHCAPFALAPFCSCPHHPGNAMRIGCAVAAFCFFVGVAFAGTPSSFEAPGRLLPHIDHAYPGALTLDVDATDLRHKIYDVKETIPVVPGTDVTLLYPQWETASHAPTGSVSRMAGLIVHAGDLVLRWVRDPYNPYAFKLHIPEGASLISAQFQFLSPATARAGPLSMTASLINVQWQSMLLYPAGYDVRAIPVAAQLELPEHFTAFTALNASSSSGLLHFDTVSLDTLVDSPVYAGRYTRRISLTGGSHPVYLDLLADTSPSLAISDATIERFRRTVEATEQLFGTPPWKRYEMMTTLSDTFPASGGTEHLQSAENNLTSDFFTHEQDHLADHDLIWHELVHAWNGKHRIPEGLWTPNFNTPADDRLLWVYEGQTQFWGEVMAARLGHRSRQDTLDMWALEAAMMLDRSGRAWKSLADSSLDPVYDAGHHVTWPDWQRREDYYLEGPLFWLDVDATVREKSGGRYSLDDFAKLFFKGAAPDEPSLYSFTDLCNALNKIAPNDWADFLNHKLNDHDNDGLLDGLGKNGYALSFSETPTPYFLNHEKDDGVTDLTFSIGATVDANGTVRSLVWHGPAFNAGVSLGNRILEIGNKPFSSETLKATVANSTQTPVRLNLDTDEGQIAVEIPYRGPLRYPYLKRVPGTADGLTKVLGSP